VENDAVTIAKAHPAHYQIFPNSIFQKLRFFRWGAYRMLSSWKYNLHGVSNHETHLSFSRYEYRHHAGAGRVGKPARR
jgi:hypothetical protein